MDSEKLLEVFADAWNRHDVDSVMSMMTDDGIFEASAGNAVDGERHEGQDAVGAAFAAVFAQYPDAHCTRPRSVLARIRRASCAAMGSPRPLFCRSRFGDAADSRGTGAAFCLLVTICDLLLMTNATFWGQQASSGPTPPPPSHSESAVAPRTGTPTSRRRPCRPTIARSSCRSTVPAISDRRCPSRRAAL
jgi:hypothetical protein